VRHTADLLTKSLHTQADGLVYEPGLRTGQIAHVGTQVVNVHQGSDLKPREGDPTPFLDFMRHLIPGERDRALTLNWFATLASRPDIRMHYELLLISETQGVGKTTFFRILSTLIGVHNCSFPDPGHQSRQRVQQLAGVQAAGDHRGDQRGQHEQGLVPSTLAGPT
jgi:hypothetical protein